MALKRLLIRPMNGVRRSDPLLRVFSEKVTKE